MKAISTEACRENAPGTMGRALNQESRDYHVAQDKTPPGDQPSHFKMSLPILSFIEDNMLSFNIPSSL